MALNKKEEAERLRIQLEIEEAIERQTKSLSSWRAAQKELVKNAKLLKSLSADIAALEEEAKTATRSRKKEIKEQIAELQKQETQLKSINKELSNAKNLLKAAGNSAVAAFKGVLPSLSEVINKVLELDDLTRQTAASIGLSGAGFKSFQASARDATEEFSRMGFSIDTGIKTMASFNEETGRAVILSRDVSRQMAETARATGLSGEEFGTLVGQMEAFGMGAGQATQMIADIQSMSESMGVNSGKVIKKFQQNLGMLNKLNFRGGSKALAKMAAHSEKFKLSMEAVAGVADKVFRPEGAIEASARLQTMGGSLSQLGDPFQLMYQARNAPEELAKSITKAARESAVFNKQTGEFEMSAHELDRLRESADALGMDYQELVQTAKQAAKIEYFEQFLGGMSEEEKGLITGMTQMTKKGAEITFTDAQGKLQTKLLGDLSKTEKENILKRAESDKERAEQAMSVAKNWEAIQNGLLLVAVNILQPLVDWLNEGGGLAKIRDGLYSFVEYVRKDMLPQLKAWGEFIANNWGKILTGAAIAFATYWIAQQVIAGMAFGRGFSMTASVRGAGGVGVGKGGAGAAGGAGKGLGRQASQMGSMMKGLGNAAQILAVGAALMMVAKSLDIFADAMIKLKEVPTGLLIGVGTGLLVFVTALGILGGSGIGWIGVAIMLAVGAALLMIGGAVWLVSAGIAMVVDSFTNMFSIINMDNIGAIMMLGPALMLASLGIMALAASIVVMGLALMNPFGLLGLIGLASAAESLNQAFGDVDAGGITEAVTAVNSVNKENIDALKELSAWLAFAGSDIKIEFGEIHVNGEIGLSGAGGGTVDLELLKNPIFMRELKKVIAEHTHFDKKGGR